MKVEIWSDVMCPFCYIGKRHFEHALEQFSEKNQIEVVWKSFQLDPSISVETDKGMTIGEYLSIRKGISSAQVDSMNSRVEQMAKAVGLTYHLSSVILANSFKTHRVIQYAKTKGLGDSAEEVFFHAYFIRNLDLGNDEILMQIGKEIGLTDVEVQEALTTDKYAYDVKQDIVEAKQIGVTGVPFFVFDRKYGVSGAQPTEAFLETLKMSFAEWKEKQQSVYLDVTKGDGCSPGGTCTL